MSASLGLLNRTVPTVASRLRRCAIPPSMLAPFLRAETGRRQDPSRRTFGRQSLCRTLRNPWAHLASVGLYFVHSLSAISIALPKRPAPKIIPAHIAKIPIGNDPDQTARTIPPVIKSPNKIIPTAKTIELIINSTLYFAPPLNSCFHHGTGCAGAGGCRFDSQSKHWTYPHMTFGIIKVFSLITCHLGRCIISDMLSTFVFDEPQRGHFCFVSGKESSTPSHAFAGISLIFSF
jgi:hypothetical protein